MTIRTRFAPSPTGFLHVGGARTALFAWLQARANKGTFILRIEDTDLERSKPQFTDAIFEDLNWLGLKWPKPIMVQSSRFQTYQDAAQKLKNLKLLYPCFCSRKEIKSSATEQLDPDGAPVYPGTCLSLSVDEVLHRQERGDPAQYRLDMHKAVAIAGMLSFTTAQPTPLDRPKINFANPIRWGDVVIQRKGTPTSYHLAVVVDDAAQSITHVTRGRDMEAATDIHVLLQLLLGLPSPIYTFHKLILDTQGKKLSKSVRSLSLQAMRKAGAQPKDIRAQLGF